MLVEAGFRQTLFLHLWRWSEDLSLILVMCYIITLALRSWRKSQLIVVYVPFNVLLNSVSWYF